MLAQYHVDVLMAGTSIWYRTVLWLRRVVYTYDSTIKIKEELIIKIKFTQVLSQNHVSESNEKYFC